jgi:hypothetical protein
MVRRTVRAMLLLVLAVPFCNSQQPQETKTITIRILDSKTERPLTTTGFLIRVNHLSTIHADLTKENEDLTGTLTLPADAKEISIHASYDDAMSIYINCDAELEKAPGDLWYKVSDILNKGIVTPNGCANAKSLAKFKLRDPKPGEIILFVRTLNWKERAKD